MTDRYTNQWIELNRRSGDKLPYSTFWEATAGYSLSYERMPRNLPLKPVSYGPLRVGDVAAGNLWPPPHMEQREMRMVEQEKAARGDMTPWVLDPVSVRFCPPWFRSFVKTLRASLLSSEPNAGGSAILDSVLQRMVGQNIRDMLIHGAAFGIQTADKLFPVHIRRCYPVEDDSWVISQSFVSAESDSGEIDRVRFTMVEGEPENASLRIQEYRFDDMYISELLSESETMPCTYGFAFMPDDDGVEWGKPPLDDLIPVLVTAALTYTDLRWINSEFARPRAEIRVRNADMAEILANRPQGRRAADGEPRVSPEDMERALPYIRARAYQRVDDGMQESMVVSWDNNVDASIDLLDRCEIEFNRETGMPRLEAADSGIEMSGSSIERRYEIMIAKAREMHSALVDMLRMILGPNVTWDLPTVRAEPNEGDPFDGEDEDEDDAEADD